MRKPGFLLGMCLALAAVLPLPAYSANKEMTEMQQQIKVLQDQVTHLQQSLLEDMAVLKTNSQQASDNVKQISAWAARVDTAMKQQTADADTCTDQVTGSSKAFQEQLDQLSGRLDRIAKQLEDIRARTPAVPAAAPVSVPPGSPSASGQGPDSKN